jgi:hypothetical protein
MATWKKIIVSGSQAELSTLTVDNTLTANSFSGDGASITGVVHNAGEIASQISGSFTSLSGSIATRFDGLTSDYTELTNIPSNIVSSSAQITSGLENQEVNLGTAAITASFFKGDGSQLTNIDVAQSATVIDTFTNQTNVAISHNFGSKNVLATVYNSDDQQIFPASITTTDINTVTVTFDVATSGRVIVGKGGHVVSGSIPFDNLLNVPTLVSSSNQVSLASVDGFTAYSSSVSTRFDALSTDYNDLQNIPNGIVSSSVQLGLSNADSPQFTNLILTGDLTVQGTTTSIETTNLLVEDKFVLLNSGSANPDVGGIIIDEGSGAGHAFIFNNSSGRFGFTGSLAHDATTATPNAFAAAVVDIAAGHADISEYQKNGNIKVDSGTIYIYS